MSIHSVATRNATREQIRELTDFGREARARINQAGRHLHEYGVLSPNLSFNAGIRIPEAPRFVLGGFTPRGEEDAPAAVVGFDGVYHEGTFKKSHLEIIDVYAAIFREQPHIGAAIHTHSPYLEVFAFAHRSLPVACSDDLPSRVGADIPVIAWEPRSSAGPILHAVRNNPGTPAILVGNHGLFAWGESIEEVARLVIALEDAARAVLYAEALGGARRLPPQVAGASA